MIEFKNVSIKFTKKKKSVEAVKNVSFSIEEGDIFGIIGSSGAGKSTLLRTINHLQEITEGSVLIQGIDVKTMKKKEIRQLRQKTGMIFQHFNLIQNKTVYENVAFALRAAGKTKEQTEERALKYLKFVQLEDKAHEYPSALSGGQKQRVAIARALANDAKLLLCDEPTSALDLETTQNVLELLKKANHELGVTIVIITHELEVVKEICSRVAVMNDGRLVELGNVYDVFSKPKEEFTRQLVQLNKQDELPEKVREHQKGQILHIYYLGEDAYQPVLAQVIRNFSISLNVLSGKIQYISGQPIGDLYVSIDGEKKEMEKALNYLQENTEWTEAI